MNLKLDTHKLKELLSDFYILTKIRIVIFDNELNELIAYPEKLCDFCTLIKNNTVARSHCCKSDYEACNICRLSGKLYTYTCHAGLIEAVAPIRINDIIIGYTMLGQIINNMNISEARNHMFKRCEKYGIDINTLSTAFDSLVNRSIDQIKAASKIMESCACYSWLTQLISIDEGNLVYRLDKYIDNNLQNNITVETICNVFMLSRSKLYEISNKYFGIGIAKYIRKKRINYAAKLLAQEDCLVSEASDKAGFEDYNYFSKVFDLCNSCGYYSVLRATPPTAHAL